MIQMYGLILNKMLIFKKVTSRVIRCHQMSSGEEYIKEKMEKRKEERDEKWERRNTYLDDSIEKKTCKAEGTEIPCFLKG